MLLTNSTRLDAFAMEHADAAAALTAWAEVVRGAAWKNLKDVRETYRHADGVRLDGGRVVIVFNIRGNNYRLVASVDYRSQIVNVLMVMTHREYSNDRWKGRL